MKLRECPWWPNTWRTTKGEEITSEQVSNDAIFNACELLPHGLIIVVDHNGRTVASRISPSLNAPNLEGVRDFLLDFYGESKGLFRGLRRLPRTLPDLGHQLGPNVTSFTVHVTAFTFLLIARKSTANVA